MEVDAPKYRLRVFERNFISPILSYLRKHPLLEVATISTTFWRMLQAGEEEPRLGDHNVLSSHGIMWASLLAEAAEWVRIGRAIGYFSSEIEPLPLSYGWIDFHEDRNLLWYVNRSPEGVGDLLYKSDYVFAADLTAATELLDDSAGNIELLRMLYFAPQREWKTRLGLVEEMAAALERNPHASLPAAVVQEVRWSLFEPSFSPTYGSPCWWRGTTSFTEIIEERGAELSAIRARIAAAAERSAVVGEFSISLEPSNAMATSQNESNLPLVFREEAETERLSYMGSYSPWEVRPFAAGPNDLSELGPADIASAYKREIDPQEQPRDVTAVEQAPSITKGSGLEQDIYVQQLPRLVRFFQEKGLNPQDAEDAVQEVVLRVHGHLIARDSKPTAEQVTSLLYSMARKVRVEFWQSRVNRGGETYTLDDDAQMHSWSAIRLEDPNDIVESMALESVLVGSKLSIKEGKALRYFLMDRLSPREMASQYGGSAQGWSKTMQAGLAKIRDYLAEEQQNE